MIHLAAEVGGIGANRANPGRYWYANLMMGAHVIEQSRLHGVDKLVLLGTVCSYPKFAPVPFREEDLWEGYPEETNAPYGVAKKALLVGAQTYREQYGLNAIFLLPVNLYGPRDNFDLETSHVIPALIRKMLEAARRARSSSGATARRRGVPLRRGLRGGDRARRSSSYDGSEPVNLGSGEDLDPELAEEIADATGFEGEIVWDTTKPGVSPGGAGRTARQSCSGFEAKTRLRDSRAARSPAREHAPAYAAC